MVNNIVDCYSDSNEPKETRIRSTTRTDQLSKPTEFRTVKQLEKSDQKLDQTQLSSIENTNRLLNEQHHQRTRLINDELKLYENFLNKNEELDLHAIAQQQQQSSVLSSYLANETITNENQFLTSNSTTTTTTNLDGALPSNGVLIDEFENSIELTESDCDNNQLNTCTFNQAFNQANSLQNDPFLSLLPYHQFATTTNTSTKSNRLNAAGSTPQTESANQSSNLTKMLLTNQDNKQFAKSTDLRNGVHPSTLDQQADLFQQFNSHHSRSNSPSDYIKLDPDNEQINKCQSLNGSTMHSSTISSAIESIDPIINEKRLLSSQKLNGEDLLFSLTSEDLNDVASYFPFLNTTDLTKDKFNCSPSLDSLNSGDSLFCSWDSPSSTSSHNSSLNNDLDLPFILSSNSNDLSGGKQAAEQSFLDSEFPFLSEDSMFDSFVNSNLNDLINTDEFFDENCTLNDDDLQFENNFNGFLNGSLFNSFQSDHSSLAKPRKPICKLSKDSYLAKLLKEKLPTKLPNQSSSSQQNGNQNNNKSLKQLKASDSHSSGGGGLTKTKDDQLSSTVNNVNTNTATSAKEVDLKKNGLITRKFTIQSVNVNTSAIGDKSTGCLARSIKIIDPVGVQMGNGNVKYLVNTSQNGQTGTANSFSLNITPTNCLTVTANSPSLATSTNQTQFNGTNAALSATKSFIIKSVDGKFANGILYTPISRNGQTTNIYASNLTGNGGLSTGQVNCLTTASCPATANGQTTGEKAKLMTALTPNSLFINNRKFVQKRPYSSVSVSVSNGGNNTQTTKDFNSIDLVPKQPFTTDVLEAAMNSAFDQSNDLCSVEIKKKIKTLDTNQQAKCKKQSPSK